MNRHPLFRVLFVLASFLSAPAWGAFGPQTALVPLPDSLHGKPIWAVHRTSAEELAIGFEGGAVFGLPDRKWRFVSSPSGQAVRAISSAHGRVLLVGSGFCGFAEGESLILVNGIEGDLVCAEPVADGWLIGGRNILWHLSTDGVARPVLHSDSGRQIRVNTLRGEVVVSAPGQPPRVWRDHALVADPLYEDLENTQIYWMDGGTLATNRGLIDLRGSPSLPGDEHRPAEDAGSGIVGIAETASSLLVARFSEGIASYDRNTGRLEWNWRELGDVYFLERREGGFLVGTARGLVSMTDPERVVFEPLDEQVDGLLPTSDPATVQVVTSSGSLQVGPAPIVATSDHWALQPGVYIRDKIFHFRGAETPLPNRYVSGVSVLRDTAAASLEVGLHLLSTRRPPLTVPLDGVVDSLASDGRSYFAGTVSQGVHVVTPEGRIAGRFGSGRATVSSVAPDEVILLFWDGTIMDNTGRTLGRVDYGNPRAAARIGRRLFVLVTRPDQPPVVGVIDDGNWYPVEIPGLAEIGAEYIAGNNEFLFVAGSRGLLRVRAPLPASQPPKVDWHWSAPAVSGEIRLPDDRTSVVQLAAGSLEFPPAPAMAHQLRTENGEWTNFESGGAEQIPVGWGRTAVTVRTERNGLSAEQEFVVVRPWPWWLRGWAWPLHAIGLLGLALGLSRLRTRRLTRRNRELESRVAARTQELRKANAIKEEFLASISHEIRNPLNGVVGICAMLGEREVGPREQHLVRTLGGCADQLRSMLDDILDFSRIEKGVVSLTSTNFELCALIDQAARVMDADLTACSLMLPEHPVWLHGDSGKLRQLVCNLVSNALKYGVPREAGIELRTARASEGKTRLRIAVRNTGPTIPAAELSRLFESFRRGAHTTGIPGSGLGLAVCRRLAEAMGGRLLAASADGVTEFALELTLPDGRPPGPAQPAPQSVSRALAIEDADYNRLVLGHVLHALGYSVDWAEDAAGALRLAARNPYDLVLTDWRLPDMEGGELCRRLLTVLSDPKPPVIAVTAYATAEKLDEARAAGMSGFVTKPVTREKLERVIRDLSTGLQPKRSLDIHARASVSRPENPLASLGELAPSAERLAGDIAGQWRGIAALAGLRDPRTSSAAHAIRSLVLLAGEESAAEQIGLLEAAAAEGDWDTVRRLLPFVAEEVAACESRLRL